MKAWLSSTVGALRPLPFFITTAGVFGIVFLLIAPPFQGADEAVHFFRAYQISGGNMIVDEEPEGVGGRLPLSLSKVVDVTNQPPIQFHPELKYNIRQTKEALTVRDVDGQERFYDFSSTAAYSPIPYIPSAAGIAVARALRAPPLVTLYAGRLGNLVAWIALIAIAIRLIPARKWALVAVGLLPMGLFQAAMLNGDVITVGALVVFLAAILHFREQKMLLGKRELALLMLAAAAMVLSKQIMFVFLPIALLLVRQNFATVRAAWTWKALLIAVPLILYACWFVVAQSIDVSASYGNGQNPSAQISFMLHNPHGFVQALWNTYFHTWGDYITRSFIGTFGWADTPLSEAIVVVGYVGLFVLLAGSYEKRFTEYLSLKAKQLLAVLVALYVLAVSAALYVYYSPVGYNIIVGLQGRYYLPIAVAAIPFMRIGRVKVDRMLYRQIAVFLPVFLLVASTITIIVRYYLHNV